MGRPRVSAGVQRTEARIGSLALHHLKPEAVPDAVRDYALHIGATVGTGPEADALGDDHAHDYFAAHARRNPHQAAPPPKRTGPKPY